MVKFIKIILIFGILAAAAYAVFVPAPDFRSVDLSRGGERQANKNISTQDKDYSSLLAKIESSHLFTALARQSTGSTSSTAESLSHAVENFRLAGVMTSGGIKAIIEDKKKGSTIYVKEGEIFGDNICVEKISGDSVKLTRGGEQAELRL